MNTKNWIHFLWLFHKLSRDPADISHVHHNKNMQHTPFRHTKHKPISLTFVVCSYLFNSLHSVSDSDQISCSCVCGPPNTYVANGGVVVANYETSTLVTWLKVFSPITSF